MSATSVRRAIASALTAGAVGVAGLVVAAPPAQAARGVSFCFTWEDGRPYANKPAYLKKKVEQKAVRVRRTVTDADGCGMFAKVRTKKKVWVRAAYVESTPNTRFWYAGNTPRKASAGRGGVDLGTGEVRAVRAISATSAPAPR